MLRCTRGSISHRCCRTSIEISKFVFAVRDRSQHSKSISLTLREHTKLMRFGIFLIKLQNVVATHHQMLHAERCLNRGEHTFEAAYWLTAISTAQTQTNTIRRVDNKAFMLNISHAGNRAHATEIVVSCSFRRIQNHNCNHIPY